MRKILALPAVLALAACSGQTEQALESGAGALEAGYVALSEDLDTRFQLAYLATPFAEGEVSVVAAERGELRTYRLTPCRQGTRICGSHPGTVSRDGVFTVVSGAYPGRTFLLAQGGDGALKVHGSAVPLAWEFTRDKPLSAPAIWSSED